MCGVCARLAGRVVDREASLLLVALAPSGTALREHDLYCSESSAVRREAAPVLGGAVVAATPRASQGCLEDAAQFQVGVARAQEDGAT